MTVRVAVVDDDDITRLGVETILAAHEEIDVVCSLSHEQAMEADVSWGDVEVALVDAADERQAYDQFPGVQVVERIRASRSPEETMVIVVTGHFFDDAVRRRMREAKADLLYHRSQIQDRDRLCEVVLHPERGRAAVPAPLDSESLWRLGISDSTSVNDAVRAAAELDLVHGAAGGRSRARTRLRDTFNNRARLSTVNADGTQPDRSQDAPSFPQIDRFVQWATRSKLPR
jgi:DNA-binding NarL/FixJ family response regulator